VHVYLTDFWRRPLPAASATGTVTLELTDGDRALPLAVAGDALEGSGPALHGAEVTARVALSVGGKPVEMDFALPVGAGGAGAAGVSGARLRRARREPGRGACAALHARLRARLAARSGWHYR